MLAHRPGFTAPTLAARQIATLDQFSRGRLAVHFISGGSDSEQQRDGDFLDHDARYARTDEYLGILRRIWTEAQPFDHDGAHYRFKQGFGSEAVPAAACADLFRRRIGSGARSGRQARGRLRAGANRSTGARPDHARARRSREAWPRASPCRSARSSPRPKTKPGRARIASSTKRAGCAKRPARRRRPAAERRRAPPARRGRTRLARRQAVTVDRDREAHRRTLDSTALVGTPEQVADALLDYYDLGVTTFLIRGFDPLEDAIDYGRELIPRVRSAVAARDAARGLSQRSLLEPSAIMSAVLARLSVRHRVSNSPKRRASISGSIRRHRASMSPPSAVTVRNGSRRIPPVRPLRLLTPTCCSSTPRGETAIGTRPLNKAAFAIHAAIHEAHPHIVAAAHTHSTYGKACVDARPPARSAHAGRLRVLRRPRTVRRLHGDGRRHERRRTDRRGPRSRTAPRTRVRS